MSIHLRDQLKGSTLDGAMAIYLVTRRVVYADEAALEDQVMGQHLVGDKAQSGTLQEKEGVVGEHPGADTASPDVS